MIAVDTNVVLRLIVGDDEPQATMAEQLFATAQILLLSTVMLETEWVLRSRYRFDRTRIAELLLAVISMPHVSVEHGDAVVTAVERYRTSGDFADLMHIACIPPGVSAFVTFDKGVSAAAGEMAAVVIETLA